MPDTFGQYQLHEKVAQGGMAEVFLASKQGEVGGFKKRVAIKRMFPHLVDQDDVINMFIDEARIASRLHHSNIVQIYDLGVVDGTFFIAMEYIDGLDLRRICELGVDNNQFITRPMAVYVAAEVAAGLQYAHTQTDENNRPMNIIHRDISPQNVLLSVDGAVKICDFGIAKAESRLTQTRVGEFKGKFSYMSPEQFGRGNLDHRSDIFTLGIVLYETTAATRLFRSDSEYEAMRKITSGEITPPSDVRPDYPPGLEEIVLTALALEPADRYQSAAAMQSELEDWLFEQRIRIGRRQLGEYVDGLMGNGADADRGDDVQSPKEAVEPPVEVRQKGPDPEPEKLDEPTTQMTLSREQLEQLDGSEEGMDEGDSTIELSVSEEKLDNMEADSSPDEDQSGEFEPTIDETVSADTFDQGTDSTSSDDTRQRRPSKSESSGAVEIRRISPDEARRRRKEEGADEAQSDEDGAMPTIVDDLDDDTTAPIGEDEFASAPTQVVQESSGKQESARGQVSDDSWDEVDETIPHIGSDDPEPSSPVDAVPFVDETGEVDTVEQTGEIENTEADQLLDEVPDLRPGGRELTGLNELPKGPGRRGQTEQADVESDADSRTSDNGDFPTEVIIAAAVVGSVIMVLLWAVAKIV